jgi:prepilin-type N-terminal cleavage/methylation domain-containing protein
MLVALPLASMKRPGGSSGFSLIEVMVSMSVMMVLAAIAVPMVSAASSNVKLRDNAETVSNYVGLAKMRATARFSRARVYVDLSNNTFVLQTKGQAAGAAWANDTSVITLPKGVTFSFGVLDAPPTNTQPAIRFADKCVDDATPSNLIDHTSCIMFNSRGIPIDKDGSPVGANAFYLTDGTGVRAITVTATPLIRNWWSSADHAGWVRQ